MKRFYKDVTTGATEGGYGIFLDGKSLKTPAKQTLIVASAALADALAEEWAAQGDTIEPASMQMMQLVSTAIDRMALTRAQVTGHVVGFGESDLLCYRTEAPMDLAALQAERWQPWLDWAAEKLNARLGVTVGVTPVVQDPDSLAALRQRVESYDDWTLTALQSLAPCLGSLVLALAVVEEALSAEEAFELARLDENFQNELWGVDDEAKIRTAGLRTEIMAAARMLDLIKAGRE